MGEVMPVERPRSQDLRIGLRYQMLRILARFTIPWIEAMASRRAEEVVTQSCVVDYLVDGGAYVDIGTGPGHVLKHLVTQASSQGKQIQMIGVEPWAYPFRAVREDMMEMSKRDGEQRALFTLSSAQSLPIRAESLDGVTCFFVLHHIPHEDWPMIFHEVRRVLKTGGVFCLVEDTPGTQDQARAVAKWDRRTNYELRATGSHLSDTQWRKKFEEFGHLGLSLQDEVHFTSDDGRGKIPHTMFALRAEGECAYSPAR